MSDDAIAFADVPTAGTHQVPGALYWEARCRRAEVEIARLKLEMALREIERTNPLIVFAEHGYTWDDDRETVTRS